MNTIKLLFSKISDEWHDNQRFRLGGWLIIIIGFTFLILKLSDLEKKFQEDYKEKILYFSKLKNISNQKDWPKRVDAAKSYLLQVEKRLWKANSYGVAQAKIQIWVDLLIKNNMITDPRVKVEQTRELTQNKAIWQVAAQIEAPFEQESFFQLLKDIETHSEIVRIEQMNIIKGEQPYFSLVLKAYFQANST